MKGEEEGCFGGISPHPSALLDGEGASNTHYGNGRVSNSGLALRWNGGSLSSIYQDGHSNFDVGEMC